MSSTSKYAGSSSQRASALDLQAQLSASPYREVRQLTCELDQGHIIMRGTVHSYYLKQVAESLGRKLIGVEGVVSDIDVRLDVK